MATNRQVLLTRLPQEKLGEDCFQLAEAPVPEAGPGEVLCRTAYLSIDAANRAWMQGATYRSALESGQVMSGSVLARVEASRADGFEPGDLVLADYGWQERAAVPASSLEKLPDHDPISNHLSVLGVTGLTAYFGVFDVGLARPGETLLVSAAGGAVGSVAGQLGKLAGCRVVGTAGTEDKCRWLVDELGYDAAVNYREDGFYRSLRAACPDGIDCYFDNTGGDILGAALFQMNLHGRIVCCGVVSQYDTASPSPGPRGVPGLLVTKRIRMEGFIVMDFFGGGRKDAARRRLARWVDEGRLRVVEDVFEGLESAPRALVDLLGGGNLGKRMVHVSD
jgi:NADPH-dependent curcumin reductase CurA